MAVGDRITTTDGETGTVFLEFSDGTFVVELDRPRKGAPDQNGNVQESKMFWAAPGPVRLGKIFWSTSFLGNHGRKQPKPVRPNYPLTDRALCAIQMGTRSNIRIFTACPSRDLHCLKWEGKYCQGRPLPIFMNGKLWTVPQLVYMNHHKRELYPYERVQHQCQMKWCVEPTHLVPSCLLSGPEQETIQKAQKGL